MYPKFHGLKLPPAYSLLKVLQILDPVWWGELVSAPHGVG